MTAQPYHVKLAKYKFMLLCALHQSKKNNDAQHCRLSDRVLVCSVTASAQSKSQWSLSEHGRTPLHTDPVVAVHIINTVLLDNP